MPHQVTFVEWMKSNELKANGGSLDVCGGVGDLLFVNAKYNNKQSQTFLRKFQYFRIILFRHQVF
jgi:ubiquinone/menaquinone biosynthesis C-methylase UbiE